jgi:hypothetical protein
MSDSPSLIMIQFLAWVADRPRSYGETMDAWRTSCPRLSVWEDAVIANWVRLEGEGVRVVTLTERGAALLRQAQNQQPAPTTRAEASAGLLWSDRTIRSRHRRRVAAGSRTY